MSSSGIPGCGDSYTIPTASTRNAERIGYCDRLLKFPSSQYNIEWKHYMGLETPAKALTTPSSMKLLGNISKQKKKKNSNPVTILPSSLPSASSRTGSPCSLLVFCINEHALLFLSFIATFQPIRLSLGSSFGRALPRDISCLFKCCCAVRLKKQICYFQLDLFISQYRSTTYSHTKDRKTDTKLKTKPRDYFPLACSL